MITLAIDACTYVGTVAVLRDRLVLAARETEMRGREVERLMPAVVDVLAFSNVEVREVTRVVCGDGPGSFTSLRIAASIAKAIAMGVPAELRRVSSLALIPAASDTLAPGHYLAALDALRGEAYFQRFERTDDGTVIPRSGFYLGPLSSLAQAARDTGSHVVAPAATLELIAEATGAPLGAATALAPHARGVARLEDALERADLAAWEPRYGRLAEAQVKWEAEHGRPLAEP